MQNIYLDATYLANNPTWHEEDSVWKATQIQGVIAPRTAEIREIAEIGCGAGAILARLHQELPSHITFHGFDIAPEAIARARALTRDRLSFHQEDLLASDRRFDLLLIIDVIEHVPDYLAFVEKCGQRAKLKLYHIPLDLHVSSVLRGAFLSTRYSVGHLHYFTAESAVASIRDTGQRILDVRYTQGGLELASVHRSLKRTLANIPRRLLGAISTPMAARLLGGYSLLVLAE